MLDERFKFFVSDYLVYEKHCVKNREMVLTKKKGISQRHDKIFKSILEDTTEMSKFLKHFLNIRIQPEDLQPYGTETTDEDNNKIISDIIYKDKNSEIYYIVEHQSRIDERMPFRMLCYCVALMRRILKNKEKKVIIQ